MDWFGESLRPLSGGYSGETYLVGDPESTGSAGEPSVLRIYARHPERALVDAALLDLVRGIVPVPGLLDVRAPEYGAPGVIVTEYVAGARLDQVLADPPDDLDWERLGAGLGVVLARLSGIPFRRPGLFADADLRPDPGSLPLDLRDFAQTYRDTGRLAAWSESDWSGLLDLIDAGQDLLDAADTGTAGRVVLAHSDLNPKNIVVDPDTADVRAVLDWEFAHAGSRFTDVGNLTRFERDERWVDPMVEAFTAAAPPDLDRLLERGRAADLWALVELAGRTPTNPVGELASRLLLAQVRAADLAAWPFASSRAAPAAR